MQNEHKREIHYRRANEIEDRIFEKAMKITNELFNIDDLNEPNTFFKTGFRSQKKWAKALEETDYFMKYKQKVKELENFKGNP